MKATIKYLSVGFIILIIGCSERSDKDIAGDRTPTNWKTLTQDEREYEKAGKFNISSRNTISYFYTPQGTAGGKGYLVEELFYDEEGRKKNQVRYFSDGDIDLKWDYNYDDEGNMIEMSTHDAAGRLFYSIESEFEEGLEVSRKEYDIQLKEPKYKEFEYSEDGFLTQIEIYDEEEELESVEKYEYRSGQLVLKSTFGKNMNLIQEVRYSYDDNFNKISEVKFSPPSFNDTIKYSYDDMNNLVEIDASYYKQEFSYDDNGNTVVEKFYSDEGFLQQLITYTYDFRGLLIEKVKHDGEENPVLLITYHYDFY